VSQFAVERPRICGNSGQNETLPTIRVEDGLIGTANCAVTADAATWLGFLRKEKSIVWAVIRRKVRVRGGLRLLAAFGRCFPS